MRFGADTKPAKEDEDENFDEYEEISHENSKGTTSQGSLEDVEIDLDFESLKKDLESFR